MYGDCDVVGGEQVRVSVAASVGRSVISVL